MAELSVEQRLALIEQRHADVAQHVTILTEMQERAEKRTEEIDKRMLKTDKRINRLYEITLRIGADFAERLRKLEQGEEGQEPDSEGATDH